MSTDLKRWQKKVITIYEKDVCDLSFDHVSIVVKNSMGISVIHEFHELGYDACPSCNSVAPIINLMISKPSALIKICECGYEAPITRPSLSKNLLQTQ